MSCSRAFGTSQLAALACRLLIDALPALPQPSAAVNNSAACHVQHLWTATAAAAADSLTQQCGVIKQVQPHCLYHLMRMHPTSAATLQGLKRRGLARAAPPDMPHRSSSPCSALLSPSWHTTSRPSHLTRCWASPAGAQQRSTSRATQTAHWGGCTSPAAGSAL
jgi:hypothetical protein